LTKNNKNPKIINSIFAPILFSVLIALGIIIGMFFDSSNSESFVTSNSKYQKIDQILDYVDQEYVDSINTFDFTEKIIPKLLESLDPHSVYIPAKDLLNISESLEGNFEGIGVQFNIVNDTIVVINTIADGPSEKIGVLPGDRIIEIEDENVAGIKIKNEDVIKKLKGEKGTGVNVSILRNGFKKPIYFKIIRDKIPLFSIDVAYMISENVGYIKINEFSATTYQEFKKATSRLIKKGMKKIILDLRGNGGGYMDAAVKIADEFLSENKLIVYTKGKTRPKTVSYSTKRGICEKLKLEILIDEWSASASEILAGAIQDNDRGLIIGRRSSGKGLVQEQTILNDGSAVRLTIARYYTPTGRSIQKPYSDGNDKYIDEISKRFLHGEFQNSDSIKFPDSLKFKTPKGKIVYGGGGIMPDVFIPIDTLGWTPYLSEVINKGIIYRFSFDYVDKNRTRLSKYKSYLDLEQHLDKLHLLNQFIVYANDKGVKTNYKEIVISENILNIQLKANIARNIFGDEGYYPIMQQIDLPLLKSIELINK
jgi:carboxyl-terminal processing protease